MLKVIKCILNNVFRTIFYFILMLFKMTKVPIKSDILSTLIRGKAEMLRITLCIHISIIH